MSTRYGVRISEAGDRFGYAALIPGMDYSNPPTTIDDNPADAARRYPHPTPTAEELAAQHANAVDTDRDMLPDHFEVTYTLDPNQPDTDGDGITDGYELIVLGTKADSLDTDFDQVTDGLELVLGLDPLVADNPDSSVPLAIPDDLHVDTDGDGITDWGEDLAGDRSDRPRQRRRRTPRRRRARRRHRPALRRQLSAKPVLSFSSGPSGPELKDRTLGAT